MQPRSQAASKLVFGNILLIEIASIDGDTFSPKEIVEAMGIAFGTANPLLHKLRDAGFIELVGRKPSERTLLYRIVENPWWDAARQYARTRAKHD